MNNETSDGKDSKALGAEARAVSYVKAEIRLSERVSWLFLGRAANNRKNIVALGKNMNVPDDLQNAFVFGENGDMRVSKLTDDEYAVLCGILLKSKEI